MKNHERIDPYFDRLHGAFAKIPADEFERVWHALLGGLKEAAAKLLRLEGRQGTFTQTKLAHHALFALLVDDTLERLLEEHELPTWKIVANRELSDAETQSLMRVLSVRMSMALRDRAKDRRAIKRGGDRSRVPLEAIEENALAVERDYPALIADVMEFLDAYARDFSARAAEAARMRWFLERSMEDIAATFGVSVRTIERELADLKKALRDKLDDQLS